MAALVLLFATTLSGGCSAVLTNVPRPGSTRESSAQVALHDDELTLHLASPLKPPSASTPLVLYASGDGGWFGTAVGMFRTIASSGLPTVGFSTKEFMRIEQRRSKLLTVADIATGYQRIIDRARAQLGLSPDAPVVLTGWSRGASLAVLVASSREADPRIRGLVAVGLAADEHLDIEGDSDEPADAGTPVVDEGQLHARSIAMYPLLAQIEPRRSVVIQASNDGYLTADRARALFGSDATTRRLVAIDAKNHRFGGGERMFNAALADAVRWVSVSREESR